LSVTECGKTTLSYVCVVMGGGRSFIQLCYCSCHEHLCDEIYSLYSADDGGGAEWQAVPRYYRSGIGYRC